MKTYFHRRFFIGLSLLLLLSVPTLTPCFGRADSFVVDPATVLREGPAYRYPQSGWIIVHTDREPYDRGYQFGKLLAPEIAGYVRCFAATQSTKSPSDGWKLTRMMADTVFVRKFDPEYL